jgi:hypothetical protein
MTSLLTRLVLEVDTSGPRNMLRNPSGQLGTYGLTSLDPATATVISRRGPVNDGATDDGWRFQVTTPRFARLRTAPFPVQAGTYVHFSVTASSDSTGGLTTTLYQSLSFFDALGQELQPVVGGAGGIGGSPVLRTMRALTPAGAVMARGAIETDQASTARTNLAGMYVRTGMAAADAVAPYVPANWVNILGKTSKIETEQGNTLNGVEDDLTPGTLLARIKDSSIDPTTATTLRRGRPVRLVAIVGSDRVPVWSGNVEYADVDYEDTKEGTSQASIVLAATDDATTLADTPCPILMGGTFPKALNWAATAAGMAVWDGSMTDPGVGVQVARDDSAKAADWLRRACNTYGGYAWLDSSNRLTSALVSYLTQVPSVTFSDRKADADALYYTGIGLNSGTRSLTNTLDVKRFNLDEVEDDGAKTYGPYVASGSVAEFGRSAATVEVVGGSPSAHATAILPVYATPKLFPTGLKFDALADLPKVLALAPYQAVRVKRTTPAYNDVVRVLRIRHEIVARVGGDTWLTSVGCRPLESGTPTNITPPASGADTGPSDVVPPTPGLLSERFRSTNIGIGTGAFVTVPFDAAVVSDGIAWDAANNRWTAPKDGRYQVSAAVHFNFHATGVRAVELRVNGAPRGRGQVPAATAASNGVAPTLSKSVKLADGDVVSIVAFQNSGTTLPIVGNADQITTASIAYLGP